ncbi:hypothetical protein IPH25_04630 [bacterium]|nr:MAG: hypothetical protein IPG37_01625 [bacterium]QQR61727.1 MAG: hypothetical protein IPH25_04630 [bacterium]QQR62705.1 MAG: hypothetical protein IPH67_04805 [bacterium]
MNAHFLFLFLILFPYNQHAATVQIKNFNQDLYTVVLLPTFITATGQLYVFVEHQNNRDSFLSSSVTKAQFDALQLKQPKSADLTKVNNLLPHHFLNAVFDKTIDAHEKINNISSRYAVVYKNEAEKLCAIMILYEKVRTNFVINEHEQIYIGRPIDNINVINESVGFFKIEKQQDIKKKERGEFSFVLFLKPEKTNRFNAVLSVDQILHDVHNKYVFTFPLIHEYAVLFRTELVVCWANFLTNKQKNNAYWFDDRKHALFMLTDERVSAFYGNFSRTIFNDVFLQKTFNGLHTTSKRNLSQQYLDEMRLFLYLFSQSNLVLSSPFYKIFHLTKIFIQKLETKEDLLAELSKIEKRVTGFTGLQAKRSRLNVQSGVVPTSELNKNQFLQADKQKRETRKNMLSQASSGEADDFDEDKNTELGALNEIDGFELQEAEPLPAQVVQTDEQKKVHQTINQNALGKPVNQQTIPAIKNKQEQKKQLTPIQKQRVLGQKLTRLAQRSKESELAKYLKLLFEYEKIAPVKLRLLLFKKNVTRKHKKKSLQLHKKPTPVADNNNEGIVKSDTLESQIAQLEPDNTSGDQLVPVPLINERVFKQEQTLAKQNDKVFLVFPAVSVLPFLQKLQPGFRFQLNDKIEMDQPAVAFPIALQLLPDNADVVLLSMPRAPISAFFEPEQRPNSFFAKLPTFKEKSSLQETLFCIVSFAKKYSELEAVNYMHNLDTGIMYVSIRMRNAILELIFPIPEDTTAADQPVKLLTNTPEPLSESVVEQSAEGNLPKDVAESPVVYANQGDGNQTDGNKLELAGQPETGGTSNDSKLKNKTLENKKEEDLPWWLRWLPDLVQNWLKDFLKKKE